jgi:Kef-type K+ transport system membrane component KefB
MTFIFINYWVFELVAGIGVTNRVLSADICTAIILMLTVTTIITPIWLKKSYKEKSSSDIVR